MVGTYRETVTRILNEFRGKGYIELGRLNVAILDREALEAISEE
jgi:CRP-like cAMP-binding protein